MDSVQARCDGRYRRWGSRLLLLGVFLPLRDWRLTLLGGLGAWSLARVPPPARVSRAHLSGIVLGALEAIIAVDEAQRITLFNAGAERIFGYSAAEALGQPLQVLIPPAFRERHRSLVQAFAASERMAQDMGPRRDVPGLRKNGEVFFAEASVVKSFERRSRWLTVVLRDVTERRHAEAALRHSEEFFRTSFENAPIGMALVDLGGAFLQVNASFCALVGYTRRELLRTRTFQELTHPDDLEAELRQIRRLLGGEVTRYQLEKRYLHARGHEVPAQLTCSLVHDSQGQPLYFVGHVEDISERKRLERAWRLLADAGPRLSDSLEPRATLTTVTGLAVPDLADVCVVEVLGEDGRVVLRDGRAASEARSRRMGEWFAQRAREPARRGRLTDEVLRTGQPVLRAELADGALEAVADDGPHLELLRHWAPHALLAVPLRARGRIEGVMLFLLTERGRRYGPGELALAEELAHRAALALANAFLHERSEQAIHSRDEVLRVVAHDLRAPLQVIALGVERLRRDAALPAAGRGVLDMLRRSVARAHRLIEDLLDVARMEAGRLSMARTPRDTAPLLREVAELHRALALERSIQLTVEPVAEAAWILADGERVLQIFSNLLGNALKFTPAGGHVRVRAEPEDATMVRFAVSDTGLGIAKEDMPRLFEPFWQARRGDKQGAGLGLSIVRGLVQAHGGRLWVESAPGQGSTFFFTLPRVAPAGSHPPGSRPAP
ncbi:PAS domain S-box protein [Archangium primigenium]|uniref:PAS domain S-box protein n=1 Tax=[Archangium] primigenium TaxID=2792470 RepID=UPI00195A135E|nr:PAS domain S-box protein [Archangium primigenium]